MFQTTEEYLIDSLRFQENVSKNYIIQKNDYLSLKVYTNGGERLIDPNFEINKSNPNASNRENFDPYYLVRTNGYAKFPMVGDIYLEGYNVNEADSILQQEYAKYYEEVFVMTRLVNKRVVVLGPLGGKVIPLENENLNVIEIIALYGGITEEGRAYNIKLIRGDLENPDVQIIDLSTISGMRKASLNIQPNDILYIEPAKRVRATEVAPILSLFISILSVLVLYSTRR